MKWRIWRDTRALPEIVLWWPYHEQSPDRPAGVLYEALYALYGPMERAIWTLRTAGDYVEPFTTEIAEDHIRIGTSIFHWTLES